MKKSTTFKFKGKILGSYRNLDIADIFYLKRCYALELNTTFNNIETQVLEVENLSLVEINSNGELCYPDIKDKSIQGIRVGFFVKSIEDVHLIVKKLEDGTYYELLVFTM